MKQPIDHRVTAKFIGQLILVCAGIVVTLFMISLLYNASAKSTVIDRNSAIPNLVSYATIKQMLNRKDPWDLIRSKDRCATEMTWCLARSLDDSLQGAVMVKDVPVRYVETGVDKASMFGEMIQTRAGKGIKVRKLTIVGSKRLVGDPEEAFMREVSISAKRVKSMPIFLTTSDPVYRKWVIASGGQGGNFKFKDPNVSSLVRFENAARTTWLGLYEAADGPHLAIVNMPSQNL
ncbi:hypothetical protein [Pseudomonas amygdali]|uniref:Uncharacterized protein n=2 Tax=Pseudomonas amygdali pv. lachrymans TaxID=53707 RepID=A0AAD0PWH9_PSEAV|nr:hypothetical protein [Pseudomonas amygdali]AXH60058.1 hypothetical protein PLA107_033070 [Pseudomonas amygdali pv. lachrymans str. M301315]